MTISLLGALPLWSDCVLGYISNSHLPSLFTHSITCPLPAHVHLSFELCTNYIARAGVRV